VESGGFWNASSPAALTQKKIAGLSTVDDFVLRKPPTSANRTSFQRAARNGFNINQLQTANFNRLQ